MLGTPEAQRKATLSHGLHVELGVAPPGRQAHKDCI
jgi:hypothetical protein